MSDSIMLDPSMFLHRETLNTIAGLRQTELPGIVLPATFIRIADGDSDAAVRYLDFFKPEGELSNFLEALAFVREYRQLFEAYSINEVTDKANDMFSRLRDEIRDDDIAATILEEWHFITHQSWFFSRARKGLDKMVSAGSIAVGLSKRGFEAVVHVTIKKPIGTPLTGKETLRAASKWVAWGSPALALLFPPTAAAWVAAGGVAGNVFLNYDP